MLRLWLSLAVDYEGEVPEPLPNLDYKVATGDSLTGPAPAPLDDQSKSRRASFDSGDSGTWQAVYLDYS